MLVIGMISGTSADAIETVLCDIGGAPPHLDLGVAAARSIPFPAELQARVHAAATVERSDVEAVCLLDAELASLLPSSTAQDDRSGALQPRHGRAAAEGRPRARPDR